MFRIDNDTASAVLPAPDAAGPQGYFTGGDPGAGIAPTDVPADYMNMLMMELINVVLAGGLVPSKVTYDQVKTAINNMIGSAIAVSNTALLVGVADKLFATGDIKPRLALAAPAGWVISDGGTIGSAGSGATNRANADTSALFTLLWNGTLNAVLPIQDAAGGASVRGGSAAADFAANKRLPLPDLRGVVLRGLDLGRGFGGQANLAEYLADAFQGHKQSLPGMPRNGFGSSYGGGGAGVQLASSETETGGPIDDGVHGAPRVADATRDKSVGVVLLVKL